MNTIEYIRHRGWDEEDINSKVFSSSKGSPVTARFMMEAYADYKVEQALRIHDVVGRSEQLPCEHDYQPDITCGVDITCCTKCGDVI